jgi:hypothetical protein
MKLLSCIKYTPNVYGAITTKNLDNQDLLKVWFLKYRKKETDKKKEKPL